MDATKHQDSGSRRCKYDRAVILSLLRDRFRNGETFASLAERSGIPAHTLQWHARQQKQGKETEFVEVALDHPDKPHGASELRVDLGGGRQVVVPSGFDARNLHRLIATLEEGC